MGLDITAYANVQLVQPKTDDIECLYDWANENDVDGTVINPNTDFPLQSQGVVDGLYSYEGVYSNLYVSYSGWSVLRNLLSKLAGNDPVTVEESDDLDVNGNVILPYQKHTFKNPTDKLYLLICFSDCEGVINQESCITIFNEMRSFWEDVTEDEFFKVYERQLIPLYETFEFAATNNGVVVFS